MKLLIYHTQPSEISRPFTEAYREKIMAAMPGLNVVVTSDEDEMQRHATDTDIIAGYPRGLVQIDIATAKKLRWIHSFSAGMDRILTPAVVASDILVSNSSGVAAQPIAEHMLGMIIAWNRRFMQAFRAQQAHTWQRQEATELYGKTVLVVGLGAIGTGFARLLRPFGTRTIGVVRTRREPPPEVDELIVDEEMDARLPEADFVAICLPGNAETHHRFSSTQFAKMKPGGVIQNIGRGTIIDEVALIEALQKGTIAGALLDVTEVEPLLASSPLWDMDNVFITAHYSASSEKAMDRTVDRLILNLKAFLAGEPLPNAVDKALGY